MTAELPRGWVITTIGTLGKYINGRGFGKAEWRKTGLPIIRIQNLNDETAAFNYTDVKHERKFRVIDGDLLVAWAASLGVYIWRRGPAWLNQHIFRVEVEDNLVSKSFLYYTLEHALEGLYKKAHGSGMVHVTKDRFDNHPVRLPPLSEQARIVSKVEELFSRVEEGKRALGRVQKLVVRYRQSALKAALTGELTREWRERRKGRIASGEELLQHLLKTRRDVWEKAELERMRADGIKPSNVKWKLKYQEPIPPDARGLPELPKGWAWASLDQLTTKITSGSRDWKTYYGRGSGVFVMAQNVRPRMLDLTEIQPVDPPKGDRDAERSNILQHDILITIVGANTGDACRVKEPLMEHYVCQSVALTRPVIARLSAFLELYICCDEGGQAQFAKTIYGAGRPHLSFDQLKAMVIPLPSLEEQHEILDHVSVIESDIEVVARTISEASSSSATLRRSVLHAAFLGRLVSQDPTDVPGSLIVNRVYADLPRTTKRPAKPKHNRSVHAE